MNNHRGHRTAVAIFAIVLGAVIIAALVTTLRGVDTTRVANNEFLPVSPGYLNRTRRWIKHRVERYRTDRRLSLAGCGDLLPAKERKPLCAKLAVIASPFRPFEMARRGPHLIEAFRERGAPLLTTPFGELP